MLFVVYWPNSIHLTAGDALIGGELLTLLLAARDFEWLKAEVRKNKGRRSMNPLALHRQ